MSQEKETKREATCGPFQDPPFMKKFQAMLDKGDWDCGQMMSRMRSMCCGAPTPFEEQEESVKEKKAWQNSS